MHKCAARTFASLLIFRIDINNLCTLETLSFFFRQLLLLRAAPNDPFFDLLQPFSNTDSADQITYDELHGYKVPIIQYFEQLHGTWTRGQLAGINELLRPLLKSTLAMQNLANIVTAKTLTCSCSIEMQNRVEHSLLLSERHLMATKSMAQSAKESILKGVVRPDSCSLCRTQFLEEGM